MSAIGMLGMMINGQTETIRLNDLIMIMVGVEFLYYLQDYSAIWPTNQNRQTSREDGQLVVITKPSSEGHHCEMHGQCIGQKGCRCKVHAT